MNLSEITSIVCTTIGQQDSATVAAVNGYASARQKFIADSFPWRDLEITSTATVTAATSSVALPTGMDRVISIRANNQFLDPVEPNILIQTDPTIFERSGFPTAYQEIVDPADDTKKIVVYPTPTVDTTLLVVGKRTVPSLVNATDSPIIRNIDNALVAFALADALKRQRQYAKAQAQFQEATALLQSAQSLESSQTNSPRRAKQLTVSGNSLAELTDTVCARTGQFSLDSIVLIKEFLRRNYQQIYDSYLWPESTVIATVNSDGQQIILPVYFDTVTAIRADSSLASLVPAEIGYFFGISPQVFEQSGSAVAFSMLTPVAVKQLSTARETLTLVSTNSNDQSPVFIKGESAGVEVSESINLAGTSSVETVNEYDTPLTIAKGITSGDVVITGTDTTDELQRILAAERERKHIRLWLQPSPGTVQECLVLGKRKITPFVQDEDTPILRSQVNAALINLACADMWSKLGNDKAAMDARTRGAADIQRLIDVEAQQSAYSATVIPWVDSSPCWSDDCCDSWFISK